MSIVEEQGMVTTYEEMKAVIDRLGIVPLASLIPEHPSVNGLTKAENWHTDTELDPWGWRARFPGEGLAAYGKFIKKKAILVSKEWFPAYVAAAGSKVDLEERYNSGLATREALTLLQIIRDNQGIETRELRRLAEMKAKEKKTPFDNAVTELQGTLDIVISGVKERYNAEGEKNGWNSTSYETTSHWMKENGIPAFNGTREEAITWLRSRMEGKWTPAAICWLSKVLSW
ncbi:AlkZ-related protein [Paenibacillus sp. BAC0078]